MIAELYPGTEMNGLGEFFITNSTAAPMEVSAGLCPAGIAGS